MITLPEAKTAIESVQLVRGSYANWRLAITIEPPDPEEETEFRPDWRADCFENVCRHFREVVNLLEFQRRGGSGY